MPRHTGDDPAQKPARATIRSGSAPAGRGLPSYLRSTPTTGAIPAPDTAPPLSPAAAQPHRPTRAGLPSYLQPRASAMSHPDVFSAPQPSASPAPVTDTPGMRLLRYGLAGASIGTLMLVSLSIDQRSTDAAFMAKLHRVELGMRRKEVIETVGVASMTQPNNDTDRLCYRLATWPALPFLKILLSSGTIQPDPERPVACFDLVRDAVVGRELLE